jgi:hypothetical protein
MCMLVHACLRARAADANHAALKKKKKKKKRKKERKFHLFRTGLQSCVRATVAIQGPCHGGSLLCIRGLGKPTRAPVCPSSLLGRGDSFWKRLNRATGRGSSPRDSACISCG